MDSFDELAQALGRGVSRRTAIKRFAGGLAAAALASVVPWKAPTTTFAQGTNSSVRLIPVADISGANLSSINISGVGGWSLSTYVSIGAFGPNVEAIQYLLRHHGNADIVIDGDFGPQTFEAVRTFQWLQGLATDGVVGPFTWARLVVTVQQGDWNDAVAAAQTLLNWHEAGIVVDGDFGDQTDGAVRWFQESHGLFVDGVVWLSTWQALITA